MQRGEAIHMVRGFITFIVVLATIGSAAISSLFGLPADSVEVVCNTDYFQCTKNLIDGARHSIHIIMYGARFYYKHPDSSSNKLIRALVEANERGVDVKVILDRSNKEWAKKNTKENELVGKILKDNDVDVFFDPEDTTTHCKVVIVDGYKVLLGSTNWSFYGIERNNEANILIHSSDVAREFTKYFDRLLKRCKEMK
jgi:phosphatidylserine/phosphatidylglycerophosphate/cardiolipin synthase-like enzyme